MISIKSKIISRLISQEILFYFLAIFITLSLVILINHVFLVFKESHSVGFQVDEVYQLIWNKYTRDISLIIGLSFLLGSVFALNSLEKNSEIIVLNSAGFGSFKIFNMVLPLAILIALISAIFSIYISPTSNQKISSINEIAKNRPDFIFFKERDFITFKDQKITIFVEIVENIEDRQKLKNIYLWSQDNNKITLAKSGQKYTDSSSRKVLIDLFEGNIYNLNTNKNTTTEFKKMSIVLFDPNNKVIETKQSKYQSKSLINILGDLPKLEALVEIHYRLAFPISIFLFSFLSIQLTSNNRKFKKNFSIIISISAYLLFYNSLYISKDLILSSDSITYLFFVPYIIMAALIYIKILYAKFTS